MQWNAIFRKHFYNEIIETEKKAGEMTKKTDDGKTTYLISDLANQLGISPHTIRFYEEKGLISPERTPGNQRIYASRDRTHLKLILTGKRFGFSLDEIAEMIGMTDATANELDKIDKTLIRGAAKLQEIRQRREELALLEKDLMTFRDKLLKRRRELVSNNKKKVSRAKNS